MKIRDVTIDDAARITEIYNYYIRETVITFEIEEVNSQDFAERIQGTVGRGHPYLVIEQDDRVVGYAYADRWRHRVAYQHTVEAGIYLDHQAIGNGLGYQLYAGLIERLRAAGRYHVVIGGLTVPNEASERLHARLGFENVALFKQVGRKFDRWLDVRMMQLTLT
ncbi:MAG: N-acetyltransferase family protein [Planctomycetota bacterium]